MLSTVSRAHIFFGEMSFKSFACFLIELFVFSLLSHRIHFLLFSGLSLS